MGTTEPGGDAVRTGRRPVAADLVARCGQPEVDPPMEYQSCFILPFVHGTDRTVSLQRRSVLMTKGSSILCSPSDGQSPAGRSLVRPWCLRGIPLLGRHLGKEMGNIRHQLSTKW